MMVDWLVSDEQTGMSEISWDKEIATDRTGLFEEWRI
jgi:hypothetical protein